MIFNFFIIDEVDLLYFYRFKIFVGGVVSVFEVDFRVSFFFRLSEFFKSNGVG